MKKKTIIVVKYFLTLLFSYVVSLGCTSPKNEDKQKISDTLTSRLNGVATSLYSTIQPYCFDSIIFLLDKSSYKTDTTYQISVSKTDLPNLVEVKINIVLPYGREKNATLKIDTTYLVINKGYRYIIHVDKWNSLITSSSINNIIDSFKNEELIAHTPDYRLYYNKKFVYPNESDEYPYAPYKQLENDIVRKIMNEILEKEKNPYIEVD